MLGEVSMSKIAATGLPAARSIPASPPPGEETTG